MEILKTIPAKENHPHNVNVVVFNLTDKKAYVTLEPAAESHRQIMIDVAPILSASTTTQRNTVISFFKKIIAEAIEITEVKVPDVLV